MSDTFLFHSKSFSISITDTSYGNVPLACHSSINLFFAQSSKIGTAIKGFYDRLANQPFLVCDFLALWHSIQSARVPKVSQPGVKSLN